jgi:hypothetical protein
MTNDHCLTDLFAALDKPAVNGFCQILCRAIIRGMVRPQDFPGLYVAKSEPASPTSSFPARSSGAL